MKHILTATVLALTLATAAAHAEGEGNGEPFPFRMPGVTANVGTQPRAPALAASPRAPALAARTAQAVEPIQERAEAPSALARRH